MKWKKFILFNLLGALLWVGFWIGLTSFLGNNKKLLVEFIKRSEYIFPLIFLTPFLIEEIYHLIKKIASNSRESSN